MEFNLLIYDGIFIHLTAGVTVLLSREIFRNWLLNVYQRQENLLSFGFIDPLALASLSLFGFSWGGLIQPERKDNFSTFLLSQLWFIALLAVSIIYFKFNQPKFGTAFYIFLKDLTTMCYGSFIINFLPILPYDASWFYAQSILRKKPTFQYLIGFIILILIFFIEISDNLFYRNNFLKFVGF